jgi:hypothetical protein
MVFHSSRLRTLPPQLRLDTLDLEDGQYEALRFILSGHLLDCEEAMYWQFVVDAIYSRPHQGQYAEEFLRKGLKVCLDRIEQNRKGFYHRHHGTWLMLRSCARSSLVLLAAIRCESLAALLPRNWRDAVEEVTMMLDAWKQESMDVCEMLGILQTLLGTRSSS